MTTPANENAPECYQHSKASETEASPFTNQDSAASPTAQASGRIRVMRDWKGTSIPATAAALADWCRRHPAPDIKPKGSQNAANLGFLITPTEDCSGVGHPKIKGHSDVAFTHGCQFDLDKAAGHDIPGTIERVESLGYAAVFWFSHNDSEANPSGRLLVLLDPPCPAADHAEVYEGLRQALCPLAPKGQHNANRGWNTPRAGANILEIAGCPVDWRHAPRVKFERASSAAPAIVSKTQLEADDETTAQLIADVWADGKVGDRAFGGLGGWLAELGVSSERAEKIADRIATLTNSAHGDPLGRVAQAYDGECPLGFTALHEALSENTGKKLADGEGLDGPDVVVLCSLLEAKHLLEQSVDSQIELREAEQRKAEALASGDDAALGAAVRAEAEAKAKIEEIKPAAGRALADELTADDLTAPLGPREWVCETLRIAPGRPVLLAGFGGRGKSWAAEALALSVASGTPVLGVPAAQGRALYLSVEQDKAEVRRRLSAICNGANVDLRALLESQALRVHTNPPRFSRRGARSAEPNPEAEKWLSAATAGVRLCVVDSLVAMSPGLDGNADEIAEALHMLARVSARTGCTFVLTAHENKVSLERGDAQTRETALKGSAALLAASSCVWSFFAEPGASEIKLVNTRCQVGPFQQSQTLQLDLSEMADGLGRARVSIGSSGEEPETKATAPMRVSVDLGMPHIAAVFEANQNRSIPRKVLEARVRARLREDKKYERLSDRKISEQVKAWIDAAIDRESLNAWKDNLSLARETFEDCRAGAVASRFVELLRQGPRTERELQADLSPAQRDYVADALQQLNSAGRARRTQSRRKGRVCETFELVAQ